MVSLNDMISSHLQIWRSGGPHPDHLSLPEGPVQLAGSVPDHWYDECVLCDLQQIHADQLKRKTSFHTTFTLSVMHNVRSYKYMSIFHACSFNMPCLICLLLQFPTSL